MRIHGYSIIAAGLVFGTTVIAPPALATTDEQVATRVTTQAQRLGVTDRTVLRIISDVASNASAILRSNPTGNLNSATGEILGVRTSITTPITFNRIAGERDVTASMNGNSVRIVTSARSYETTTTRDTLTVYVNGQQVYSGQVRNITQADLLRTYNAIGATESREITQRETARTSADVTFRVITQRVASFLAPVTPVQRARLKERQASASPSGVTAFEDKGFVGLSGGDDVLKWGAWGNIAHSWLENSGSLSAYNGGLTTGLVGADYLIHDMLLAGVALSYESLGLTTKFNSGRLDTTGIAVSPYAGVRFLDGRIVLDALYSHAWLDSSSSRNRDVAEITGSYTGSRDAAAVNLTYNHVINDFTLSPGIGLAYANERQGSFADSSGSTQASTSTYIGDLKLGARLGYSPNEQIELYTAHYYLYDLVPMFASNARSCQTPLGGCSNDRDEVSSSFGINYYYDNQITGTLEVDNTFLRADTSNTSLIGTIRVKF